MSGIDISAAPLLPQIGAPVKVDEEAQQDQPGRVSGAFEDSSLKKELGAEGSSVHPKDEVATAPADPAVQFEDEEPVTSAGPEPPGVRCVQSEVGDRSLPDEAFSRVNLSEGMESDDEWKPLSDSKSSGRWKNRDCLPQQRPKVKDEKLGRRNVQLQNGVGVVQGAAEAISVEEKRLAEIVDPEELKQAIFALCDDARRAQLRSIARRSYSNGLVFKELFRKIVRQNATCSALSPARVLSAPESEYPEIWECAAQEMLEIMRHKRAMEVICEAENLFKHDVTKQIRSAGIFTITHRTVLASITSMILDLFRASFPSLLRLRCNICNKSMNRPSHTWNTEDWSALFGKPSPDLNPYCMHTKQWTPLEGFVLGMAYALLPSWKLVRRYVCECSKLRV
jgi:hypothetical protein